MRRLDAWRMVLAGWLLAGVMGQTSAHADEAAGPPKLGPADVDCGLASLYLLLQLEGRPVALTSLAAELPARPAEGYSLRDLRNAARLHGVRSTGLRLGPEQQAPRSTCLVFVNRDGHGHFFVLRPVGHTGRLVQAFDGFGEPAVLDWTNLRKSPEWTGLVLSADPANWWPRIAPTIALIGGLAATLIVSRGGRRRPGTAHA